MSKSEKTRQRNNLIVFGYCGLDNDYQESSRNSFNVDDIRNRFKGLIDMFDIDYFDPSTRNINLYFKDLEVFIKDHLKDYANEQQASADHWDTLLTTKVLIDSLRRGYKKVFWGLSNPVYNFINSKEGKAAFSPYIDFSRNIDNSHIYRMVAPTTESAVNIILSLFKDKFQIALPISKD